MGRAWTRVESSFVPLYFVFFYFLFIIYYLFIYFLEAIMDGCYEYDQATSFMEPSNEHDFHLPD